LLGNLFSAQSVEKQWICFVEFEVLAAKWRKLISLFVYNGWKSFSALLFGQNISNYIKNFSNKFCVYDITQAFK